jgi:hypothetical protein
MGRRREIGGYELVRLSFTLFTGHGASGCADRDCSGDVKTYGDG